MNNSPEYYMRIAIKEAELSVKEGNAPFAVLVIHKTGEIVLKEHDRVKKNCDPTAHGEINAIRILCKKLRTLSLNDYIFITTSEPCPTCLSVLIKARVPLIYYGAKTEKNASLPIPAEKLARYAKKYPIKVIGRILEKECLKQRTNGLKKMKNDIC
jgi:tRNA(Arg) A34 adenosine deaminase TadA